MVDAERSLPVSPALPDSGTWTIDPAHSSIQFIVRHLVVARVRGRFSDFSGEIVVAENPEESSVTVEIKTASLDTNQADRDTDLRSGNHFDVEKYPTARFRSTGVALKDTSEDIVVDGEVTIRGVTQPVALQTHYGGVVTDPYGAQRVVFSATAELNREDFGLTWNVPLEAGGVMIGKVVRLEFDVEAVRHG